MHFYTGFNFMQTIKTLAISWKTITISAKSRSWYGNISRQDHWFGFTTKRSCWYCCDLVLARFACERNALTHHTYSSDVVIDDALVETDKHAHEMPYTMYQGPEDPVPKRSAWNDTPQSHNLLLMKHTHTHSPDDSRDSQTINADTHAYWWLKRLTKDQCRHTHTHRTPRVTLLWHLHNWISCQR